MAWMKNTNLRRAVCFCFLLLFWMPVNLRNKTGKKKKVNYCKLFILKRRLEVECLLILHLSFPAACHESCSSCWGAAENNCLSCKDTSRMLKAGFCVASCGQGFYTKDGICSGKYLGFFSNCKKFERCSAKKESIFHLAVQQLWFYSRLSCQMHLVRKYRMGKAAVCLQDY